MLFEFANKLSLINTEKVLGNEARFVNRWRVTVMIDNLKKRVTSFHDLEVYRNSYEASVNIMKQIIPKLPEIEKNDLRSQISRACKAIPRLIAEGYAKRHQKKGFQKYYREFS